MNKQNLPKCPYCDFRSADREEQKKHLIEHHHTELVEILNKHGLPANKWRIRWAAGEVAFAGFE
jgi:hypothetical protein